MPEPALDKFLMWCGIIVAIIIAGGAFIHWLRTPSKEDEYDPMDY